MYAAMLKRQAAEQIEQQKISMVAAMYANGNLGGDELTKAVEGLEKHYKEAMELVYPKPGAAKRKRGQEPDWENPFWAGAKRSYDKQKAALGHIRGTTRDMTVQEVVEHEERRAKRLQGIDQVSDK